MSHRYFPYAARGRRTESRAVVPHNRTYVTPSVLLSGSPQRQLLLNAKEPRSSITEELAKQLSLGNLQGNMYEYDVGTGGLKAWSRPHWQSQNGTMTQMGAGSMRQLAVHERPLCIHRGNPVLTDIECRMELHCRVPVRELGGQIHDIFQCPITHSPRYFMIIPLVRPRVIATSYQDIEDQLLQYGEDEMMERSIDEEDMRTYLERSLKPFGNPRVISKGEFKTSLPGALQHTCFIPDTAAYARASVDQVLIAPLKKIIEDRKFHVDIEHLEFFTPPHNPIMEPYNVKEWPTCTDIVWEHQDFLDSGVGLAIRDLNSTLGLPRGDVITLLKENRICSTCKCYFSFNGYHAHLDGHRFCLNWPIPLAVPVARLVNEDDAARFTYRTFPNNQARRDLKFTEALDHPVGLAMLAWNSRVGIPGDVWHVVFSALVFCAACNLVRTVHCDREHINGTTKNCGDLGGAPGTVA